MRRLWAAGAAVTVYLALGAPVMAQEASPGPVAGPSGRGPVHVTGTYEGSGVACWAERFCSFEGDAVADDERLTGCYWVEPAGSTTVGTWGRLTVYAACSGVWGMPSSEDPITWVGEWFTAGERAVRGDEMDAPYPVDAAWLHGLDENEGWSASLRIGDGTVDAWLFPTPVTTTVPMPGL